MKTVRFDLPLGTELETLDELSKASDVANRIQSALVIWTATWNYIYQDLIISTKTDFILSSDMSVVFSCV